MFHIENDIVRSLLLKGNFGLEKESLRITRDGNFALSLHPFPDNKNIVYDFCENQTEINTDAAPSAEEAEKLLEFHTRQIHKKLVTLAIFPLRTTIPKRSIRKVTVNIWLTAMEGI